MVSNNSEPYGLVGRCYCGSDTFDYCRVCDKRLCEEHTYQHPALENQALCLNCFFRYAPDTFGDQNDYTNQEV